MDEFVLPEDAKVILAKNLKLTDIIYVSHGWHGKDDVHTVWRKIDKIEWMTDQLMVSPAINDGESKPLLKFFYPDSLVIVRNY